MEWPENRHSFGKIMWHRTDYGGGKSAENSMDFVLVFGSFMISIHKFKDSKNNNY